MTRDQKTVAIGAASGVVTMIVLVLILHRLLPQPEAAEAIGERIGYALSWAAFAATPLLAMLAAIGNARFLSEAIDPTAGKESQRMIVDGRVADNTVQQFLLFLAGMLALAVNVPSAYLNVVGAAAITFAIMRLAFWFGYRVKPVYRAFGFAGTAYLNLGLLASALCLALS